MSKEPTGISHRKKKGSQGEETWRKKCAMTRSIQETTRSSLSLQNWVGGVGKRETNKRKCINKQGCDESLYSEAGTLVSRQ